jgi:5-methylcytosine-specific restriction endonuclease McrA
MSIYDTQILVVDKNLQPCKMSPATDVIPLLYVDKAKVLDEDFFQHTFDDWITYSEIYLLDHPDSDRVIMRSPNIKILIPEVIVITDYIRNEKKTRKLRFSRQNVFRRDSYSCQYCGKKCSKKELTIDHINPKSKGGPTSWINITSACFKCNIKKADRTPKEANMELLTQPFIPSWSDQMEIVRGKSSLWSKLL